MIKFRNKVTELLAQVCKHSRVSKIMLFSGNNQDLHGAKYMVRQHGPELTSDTEMSRVSQFLRLVFSEYHVRAKQALYAL